MLKKNENCGAAFEISEEFFAEIGLKNRDL